MVGLLLMSSLSVRQAPCLKPQAATRAAWSATIARKESRRNTRQMVATTLAGQAETFA